MVPRVFLNLVLGGRRRTAFSFLVPTEITVRTRPMTTPRFTFLGRMALGHVRVLALIERTRRLLN